MAGGRGEENWWAGLESWVDPRAFGEVALAWPDAAPSSCERASPLARARRRMRFSPRLTPWPAWPRAPQMCAPVRAEGRGGAQQDAAASDGAEASHRGHDDRDAAEGIERPGGIYTYI